MRECCRQSQAEVLSKSRNKIHQTWGLPSNRASPVLGLKNHDITKNLLLMLLNLNALVVGNLGQTDPCCVCECDDDNRAVVKLGTKMAPKQLCASFLTPHFLTPTHSARSLPRIHSPSLRSASVEKAVGSCDIQEGNEARNCVVKY